MTGQCRAGRISGLPGYSPHGDGRAAAPGAPARRDGAGARRRTRRRRRSPSPRRCRSSSSTRPISRASRSAWARRRSTRPSPTPRSPASSSRRARAPAATGSAAARPRRRRARAGGRVPRSSARSRSRRPRSSARSTTLARHASASPSSRGTRRSSPRPCCSSARRATLVPLLRAWSPGASPRPSWGAPPVPRGRQRVRGEAPGTARAVVRRDPRLRGALRRGARRRRDRVALGEDGPSGRRWSLAGARDRRARRGPLRRDDRRARPLARGAACSLLGARAVGALRARRALALAGVIVLVVAPGRRRCGPSTLERVRRVPRHPRPGRADRVSRATRTAPCSRTSASASASTTRSPASAGRRRATSGPTRRTSTTRAARFPSEPDRGVPVARAPVGGPEPTSRSLADLGVVGLALLVGARGGARRAGVRGAALTRRAALVGLGWLSSPRACGRASGSSPASRSPR